MKEAALHLAHFRMRYHATLLTDSWSGLSGMHVPLDGHVLAWVVTFRQQHLLHNDSIRCSPSNICKSPFRTEPVKRKSATMTTTSVVTLDAARVSRSEELAKNITVHSVSAVTDVESSEVNLLTYLSKALAILLSPFLFLFTWLTSTRFPVFERLWIWDLRTFRPYSLPIEHGAVEATQFLRMSPLGLSASREDHMANGLMVSHLLMYSHCDFPEYLVHGRIGQASH
jgi:hypothetical protein